MAYIWLPIGIGVAIGLLLWMLGLLGLVLWIIGNLMAIPFRLRAELRTPEGAARMEQRKVLFGAIIRTRGTPEHRAAILRYREFQRACR
ncbi:MAG TPA: hypothetical protein VND20_01870 [Candidatus Binataceae bacterium]|nr:hypothetical protein [Candidatus Binataceae bacterium]